MQTLPVVPTEIFEKILRFAIDIHPARHAIPRVNSTWAKVSLPILHSKISFISARQLQLFSEAPGELCCAPRNVEVNLPDGIKNTGMLLYNALTKCRGYTMSASEGVAVLRLYLCDLWDEDIPLIGKALGQVNPEVFIYGENGNDPELSILFPISSEFCEPLSSWSSLRKLELSKIFFLDGGLELAQALIKTHNFPSFPFDSSSTNGVGPIQIVISEAMGMLPISVLHIALGVPTLRVLRLINIYNHDVFGPTMSMDDVEGCLLTSEYVNHASKDDCLERVREVVSLVANTEALMDGSESS